MAVHKKSEISLDVNTAIAYATLSDLQKKQNAKSWSDNMELLLAEWGEKAAGLTFMHSKSGVSWKKFSNKMAVSSILVSTIASSLSLVATSFHNEETKNGFLFGVGGIGLISALIQSLSKFYQAEEKAADHNNISKQFGNFYRYIKLQMGLSREERLPSYQLTEYSLKEYERLMTDAPLLSNESIQLFKDRFKDSKQSKPDIVEEKYIIKINKSNSKIFDKKKENEELDFNICESDEKNINEVNIIIDNKIDY